MQAAVTTRWVPPIHPPSSGGHPVGTRRLARTSEVGLVDRREGDQLDRVDPDPAACRVHLLDEGRDLVIHGCLDHRVDLYVVLPTARRTSPA